VVAQDWDGLLSRVRAYVGPSAEVRYANISPPYPARFSSSLTSSSSSSWRVCAARSCTRHSEAKHSQDGLRLGTGRWCDRAEGRRRRRRQRRRGRGRRGRRRSDEEDDDDHHHHLNHNHNHNHNHNRQDYEVQLSRWRPVRCRGRGWPPYDGHATRGALVLALSPG
jgi:hypothetical protein